MVPDLTVVTLPLAGRDQGWGVVSPDIGAKPHPLLASPVKGAVHCGVGGKMGSDHV